MRLLCTSAAQVTVSSVSLSTPVISHKGSNHRSAPIESVAISKQGLTVMFYKCPTT
jgi:hypothetical protein